MATYFSIKATIRQVRDSSVKEPRRMNASRGGDVLDMMGVVDGGQYKGLVGGCGSATAIHVRFYEAFLRQNSQSVPLSAYELSLINDLRELISQKPPPRWPAKGSTCTWCWLRTYCFVSRA